MSNWYAHTVVYNDGWKCDDMTATHATDFGYALIGGSPKLITAAYILDGGAVKPITGIYTLVGGAVKTIL